MPLYPVLEPLRRNGSRYAPGGSVEMDAKEARELLRLGVIGPAPKAQPKATGQNAGGQNAGDGSGEGK